MTSFVIGMRKRTPRARALAASQMSFTLNHWIPVAPTAAFDSVQEAFYLSIESGRFFQIDCMAGVGADPKTGVRKRGFEH